MTYNLIYYYWCNFETFPYIISGGCLSPLHHMIWGKMNVKGRQKKDNCPQPRRDSMLAAWEISRKEAFLHHLTSRPGCIGTRGPCLPCRHTPFLSHLPRFIKQCSSRHGEALHYFLPVTAVRPLAALPLDEAPLRPSQRIYCPSGIRSHSLFMHNIERQPWEFCTCVCTFKALDFYIFYQTYLHYHRLSCFNCIEDTRGYSMLYLIHFNRNKTVDMWIFVFIIHCRKINWTALTSIKTPKLGES